METWKKLLLAAGGAAGVAALAYYLLKEESEADLAAATEVERATKKASKAPLTKEQLLEVVNEMVQAQKETTQRIQEISKQLATENGEDFDKLYNKIKAIETDPLEARGLTMADLEGPLDRHQHDPAVLQAMQELMGIGEGSVNASEKAKEITVEKLVEVNNFMYEELNKLIDTFHGTVTRFLPKSINQVPTLVDQGNNTWSITDEPGKKRNLLYRKSKILDDKDPMPPAKYGSSVCGTIDGEWVAVEVPKRAAFEPKTVMLAIQATLDSKVMRKFDYAADDLRASTMAQQQKLSSNPEFLKGHHSMQKTMDDFMNSLKPQAAT